MNSELNLLLTARRFRLRFTSSALPDVVCSFVYSAHKPGLFLLFLFIPSAWSRLLTDCFGRLIRRCSMDLFSCRLSNLINKESKRQNKREIPTK